MNMSAGKQCVFQSHHLGIQGIEIFETGFFLLTSPV